MITNSMGEQKVRETYDSDERTDIWSRDSV